MQARHGLSTAGVPNNSTPSTWDVWGPCFASGGRTKYQTLKSSSVLSVRASTPFCCALSSGGQAMFNEWTTANSQKRLLYGELTAGQRSLGRPKKRYKDSLKESLKRCDIPSSTWEASANDRPAWCSLVSAGVLAFEENCIREKDQIRQRRKERSSNPQTGPAPSIPCPHCNRHFRAKIGLFSHLCTHSTSQWYEVMIFFASEGQTSSSFIPSARKLYKLC